MLSQSSLGEALEGQWLTFNAERADQLEALALASDGKDWGETSQLEWGSYELLYAKKFLSGFVDGHEQEYSPGSIRVFVTREGEQVKPRVALFYRDDELVEIRGFAEHQQLDLELAASSVLRQELAAVFPKDHYLVEMAVDAQALVVVYQRTLAKEELTLSELSFLYEVFEPIKLGFGYRRSVDEDGMREMKVEFSGQNLDYHQNPILGEVLGLRDVKSDLSRLFEVEPSEVAIVDSDSSAQQVRPEHKVVFGDYTIESLETDHIPSTIVGDLYVKAAEVRDRSLAKLVTGDLFFRETQKIKGVAMPLSVRGIHWSESQPLSIENSVMPNKARRLKFRGNVKVTNVTMPSTLEELWVAEVHFHSFLDSIQREDENH
ncbi:MAG: hypothetical protein HRT45_01025 [Bdellovibrionales bacterium]|nr:hypothetical protein [Bdellovibrionales bacterium]